MTICMINKLRERWWEREVSFLFCNIFITVQYFFPSGCAVWGQNRNVWWVRGALARPFMPHRCLFKQPIWAFTTASSYYKKPPGFTFPLLYSNQTHHNKRRPKGKLSSLSNLFSLIRNNKKPWRWAVLAWEPQREDHYQAEGLEESWESKGLSFTL